MRRLLLFGNSHLGALKYGLSGHPIGRRSDIEIVFWGVHGKYFPDISYKDGVLRSPRPGYSAALSEGRYPELPVEEFDAILFYACRADLTAETRDFTNGFGDPSAYSEAFVRAALAGRAHEWFRGLPTWPIIEQVRRDFPDIRCAFSPQPMHAESRLSHLKNLPLAQRNVSVLQKAARAECEKVNLDYLPQPEDTLKEGVVTKADFGVGSMKLNTDSLEHPPEDATHMNPMFGAKMLTILNAWLDQQALAVSTAL